MNFLTFILNFVVRQDELSVPTTSFLSDSRNNTNRSNSTASTVQVLANLHEQLSLSFAFYKTKMLLKLMVIKVFLRFWR